MKSFFILVFFSLLNGCASYHEKMSIPPVETPKKGIGPLTNSKKYKTLQTGAVWELLNREKVTLYFTNVDNGSHLNVILQPGLNSKEAPKGHWELTGYAFRGQSFTSMNTSKKFVFRKSTENVYAGSVIVSCPKVSGTSLGLLKSMRFFNRYSFRSDRNLCELVVGNDLAGVRSKLRKARKNNNLNLSSGF